MNTQQGSSKVGMIALIAIALMVGIWIGAEKDIIIEEVKDLPLPVQVEESKTDEENTTNEQAEVETAPENNEEGASEETEA